MVEEAPSGLRHGLLWGQLGTMKGTERYTLYLPLLKIILKDSKETRERL